MAKPVTSLAISTVPEAALSEVIEGFRLATRLCLPKNADE